MGEMTTWKMLWEIDELFKSTRLEQKLLLEKAFLVVKKRDASEGFLDSKDRTAFLQTSRNTWTPRSPRYLKRCRARWIKKCRTELKERIQLGLADVTVFERRKALMIQLGLMKYCPLTKVKDMITWLDRKKMTVRKITETTIGTQPPALLHSFSCMDKCTFYV